MKHSRFYQALSALLLSLLLTLSGSVQAQDSGATESAAQQMSISQVSHQEAAGLEWWTFSAMGFQPAGQERQYLLTGEGRILVSAKRKQQISLGSLVLTLMPDSIAFIDKVGEQSRVMMLSGKAAINDGKRAVQLNTSLQAVRIPAAPPDYFIDDGVYRRPPMERFEDENGKTIVRQFYLEQVVYSDPMLRILFNETPENRGWIKRLNKRGAILRNLNGTWQYEEGQV